MFVFLFLWSNSGVNICSRRRDKTLFTRFRLVFLVCLSRLVQRGEKMSSWLKRLVWNKLFNKCLFCISSLKLLTNGDSSSREFVDPPGEFKMRVKLKRV